MRFNNFFIALTVLALIILFSLTVFSTKFYLFENDNAFLIAEETTAENWDFDKYMPKVRDGTWMYGGVSSELVVDGTKDGEAAMSFEEDKGIDFKAKYRDKGLVSICKIYTGTATLWDAGSSFTVECLGEKKVIPGMSDKDDKIQSINIPDTSKPILKITYEMDTDGGNELMLDKIEILDKQAFIDYLNGKTGVGQKPVQKCNSINECLVMIDTTMLNDLFGKAA